MKSTVPCKRLQPVGVQLAARRVQLLAVVLGQLGAELRGGRNSTFLYRNYCRENLVLSSTLEIFPETLSCCKSNSIPLYLHSAAMLNH